MVKWLSGKIKIEITRDYNHSKQLTSNFHVNAKNYYKNNNLTTQQLNYLTRSGLSINEVMMIEACSFGSMVIDGRNFSSDLVIYPDGRVVDNWRRERGHRLSINDIALLIESEPEVIVVGTGINGLMKPKAGLAELLSQKNIVFLSAPNQKAMNLYNEQINRKRAGACFHLFC